MKVNIGINTPQSEVEKMFELKTNTKKEVKKLEEMELYYTAERGPYLNVVLEVLEEKN